MQLGLSSGSVQEDLAPLKTHYQKSISMSATQATTKIPPTSLDHIIGLKKNVLKKESLVLILMIVMGAIGFFYSIYCLNNDSDVISNTQQQQLYGMYHSVSSNTGN